MKLKIKLTIFCFLLFSPLLFTGKAFAATQIYRSVGPSATSALDDDNSHADTLTISSTAATFSAAISDSVGVGDAIQYDTNADGTVDVIAFIHGRTDSTHYAVAASSGGTPTAVTGAITWSIYRAYTSLYSAERGDENDNLENTLEDFDTWSGGKSITTSDEQWNIACYAGQGGVADSIVVLIDDWTTDSDNFINIYAPYLLSEVGVSQRHQGGWDVGKYRLTINNIAHSPIEINEDFVRVTGLQLSNDSTNVGAGGGFYVGSPVGTGAEIILDSNIIKGGGNGIRLYTASAGAVTIRNSILYGGSANGIIFDNFGTLLSVVIENCVISSYGGRGIYGYRGTPVVKNCYSGNNTGNDYEGATLTTSASEDSTGSIDFRTIAYSISAGAYFNNITPGSEDYHIQSASVLKNVGTDLSSSFSADIDSQSRPIPYGGGWDIGAGEEGAKTVFYSVGQDATTNNMTGSPTVTIAAGVATFSAAQTGNIGVGDRVTYNVSSIMYIAGKISTTQWNVVTNTGLAPPDISGSTVVSIKREYTTLSAAEAGATDSNHLNTTDLVAGNYVLNFPCYYDTGADTTAVTVDGYTTGSSNYIKIYTPVGTDDSNNSQRHQGVWSDTKYRLELHPSNWGAILVAGEDYTRIEGIQFYLLTGENANQPCIRPESGSYYPIGIRISHNIFKREDLWNSNQYGFATWYDTEGYIWNNIFYDFNGGNNSAIYVNGTSGSWYVYNNTIHNSTTGINRVGNTVVAKNNIFDNCGSNSIGTFAAGTDYNSTDDASIEYTVIGEGNTHDRISQTFSFVSEVGDDFHLNPDDTGAAGCGTDLSSDDNLSITTDIDGQIRPISGVWDVGADETGKITSKIQGTVKMRGNVKFKSIGGPNVWYGPTMASTVWSSAPVCQQVQAEAGGTITKIRAYIDDASAFKIALYNQDASSLLSSGCTVSSPVNGAYNECTLASSVTASAGTYYTVCIQCNASCSFGIASGNSAYGKYDGGTYASFPPASFSLNDSDEDMAFGFYDD